jgi:cytochrome b561
MKRGYFDNVSILFHWVTVALFVPLIASVFMIGASGFDSSTLLAVHRSAGATIFCLSLWRFIWRKTVARLPPFPEHMSSIHRRAVTTSEYALYGLLFAQPLLGLAMMVARGHPFALLVWQIPTLVAPNKPLAHALHDIHKAVGYCFLTLIAGHALAALIHHFILRDDVLTAMLPPAKPKPRPARSTP